MSLFITMLPLYLFGNVHCLGMCGPLVMLIGHHPFRYLYFLGRICSFTMACFSAGLMGSVLHQTLKKYYLAESLSIFFGLFIILFGFKLIFSWKLSFSWPKFKWTEKFNHKISTLILKETPWSTFLFGFFTVLLPCGQTLIVFSACALLGDPLVGFFNGLAFSLLTTPSLILAMHTLTFFKKVKKHYQMVLGLSSVLVGLLACFRGLAEMDVIPHLIINSQSSTIYHLVVF